MAPVPPCVQRWPWKPRLANVSILSPWLQGLLIPALDDFRMARWPIRCVGLQPWRTLCDGTARPAHLAGGNYMCIALPNAEGSSTVTLFLPNEGDPSLASVASAADAQAFFQRDFADAVPLIPTLGNDYVNNPTGLLGTLYLDRWHLDGRALLVGDAAHAIVPFHGQGMNCGFEDAVELADLLEASPHDSAAVFAEFVRRRKPNADAIAAMALENYIEMRDRVDDADYLLMRDLDRALAERHPGYWVPRYAMVTFLRIPYRTAFERGEIQAGLLRELVAGNTRLADIDLNVADARKPKSCVRCPTKSPSPCRSRSRASLFNTSSKSSP